MKTAMEKPGRMKYVAQRILTRLLIKSLTKRFRRPFQVHEIAGTIADSIIL